MKARKPGDQFNDVQAYCVFVLDRKDPRYIDYYTAITFATNAVHAVRRVQLIWDDTRREKLYALPVGHPTVKTVIESEGKTVDGELARYAALEADAIAKTAVARARRRRKMKERLSPRDAAADDTPTPRTDAAESRQARGLEKIARMQADRREAAADQLDVYEARTLRVLLDKNMPLADAQRLSKQRAIQIAYGVREEAVPAPLEVLTGSQVAAELTGRASDVPGMPSPAPRLLKDKTVDQLTSEIAALHSDTSKAAFIRDNMISARKAELNKRGASQVDEARVRTADLAEATGAGAVKVLAEPVPSLAGAVAESEGAQLQRATAEARAKPAAKAAASRGTARTATAKAGRPRGRKAKGKRA